MNLLEKEIDDSLLEVSCAAFKSGESIPEKYTCDGLNISPPLAIKGIPYNTTSLAILLIDLDAPIDNWVHWLVWNIPITTHIIENKISGIEGLNDFQQHNYCGPCPRSGTHRYLFKIYALDIKLNLSVFTRQFQLHKVMFGHIVGYGSLMGIYKRKQ